jgi:hypothetical protein
MAILLENQLPVVKWHGLNTDKAVVLGSTLSVAGASTLTGAVGVTGTATVTGALTPTGGVAAAGGFAYSPRTAHTGGVPAAAAADFNDTTPATTETYIAEVFIPANATLTGVGVFNGSAASGNVTVGLANSSGVVVASSNTTTAQSGTDTYQRVAFTSTYSAKGPATYYVMTQHSNTTARFNSHVVGNFSAQKVTSQTYGTLADFTPATTFTTVVGPVATLY